MGEFLIFSGFSFLESYYFWVMEPNGGMWIKRIDEMSARIGISSIIAEKLDKIKKIKFISNSSIIKGKPFVKVMGIDSEIILFSPFSSIILNTNQKLTNVNLTQKNVYNENWIIEVKFQKNLSELDFWYKPSDTRLIKYIESILKREKALKDKCCPDFTKSQIVYRKKKSSDF